MIVMTARIEVPDNAGYADIEEAKIAAKWEVEEKGTKEERMRKTDLSGKCGSCRWFTECAGTAHGDCKNLAAPISVRWNRGRTQTCSKHESRCK